MNSKAGGLGEFGIVDLFRSQASAEGKQVIQGIGDDCAVLAAGGQDCWLVSTDMLCQDVHFRLSDTTPAQLGHKALAVNLSDIAAMGGEPVATFLALGLPATVPTDFVQGFRDGLLACGREHHCELLGGDTVASPTGLVFSLTVIGRMPREQVITRAGARPDDIVCLGGLVGDSAAGLSLLLGQGAAISASEREKLVHAHLQPEPQLALGRWLAQKAGVSAMIDVSDGVVQDLGHICAESGCGAELVADALPLSVAARNLAQSTGGDARHWGLSGGEDYVLLFCVPAERQQEITQSCLAELKIEIFPVGTITAGAGVRVGIDGTWQRPSSGGWDHFK